MSSNVRDQKNQDNLVNDSNPPSDDVIIFVRSDFPALDWIAREGQSVSYEVERRADNRLYAVNIQLVSEASLH